MAVLGGRQRSGSGGRRPGSATPDPLRGGGLSGAIPRGVLAGAAFAVPAVAWALLAHLPLAGKAPPPGRLLLVALVAVLLAASVEVVRSVAAAREAPAQRRRIGGPRSFGGLLAVQGLLHAALAVAGCGAGLRAQRSDPLLGVLLCHSGQATAPAGAHAAGAVVGPVLHPGLAAPAHLAGSELAGSELARSGLAHVDPALLAAARRVAAGAGTGSGDAPAGGHRHLGGLAVLGSGSASAAAVALAMLLAHALAAALMFWWARRGAKVLAAAGRLLARRLPALPAASPVPASAPRLLRPRRAHSTGRPRLLLLRHAVARRGPPAPAASRSFRDAPWQVAAV
ncbi:hypothetical protein [Frankia sp. QA3]|uniref:hypothetical protein n=1 Tax=Frankia sp. QA3 TaxID=710111 RepID=UPI001E466B98|nr:hypothetical protein [Frankia sp. QA3]